LITPASEEGRTLLRWIDAEDPAVAFTTHRPPEARLRALPKVEHVPSYNVMQASLKDPPAFKVDSRAPESQPPAAVPLPRQKSSFASSPIATSVSFSSELDAFGKPMLPAPKFVASNKETPEAIRFRVAVNNLGEIRYCFPMNSSGDPALDVQSRLFLTRCRFARHAPGGVNAEASLAWGIATIEWGSDVVRPEGAQQPHVQP
jgi:hypothetical protein